MPVHITRRENEPMNVFLYRFNKKVQRSGLVKESKKRQFFGRTENRRRRRKATLYRVRKQSEIDRERKHGYR